MTYNIYMSYVDAAVNICLNFINAAKEFEINFFEDEEFSSKIINDVAMKVCSQHKFVEILKTISSQDGFIDERGITFEFAQMISGNSPNIEKSYKNKYKYNRDSFRDIAFQAFCVDIAIAIKKKVPNFKFHSL